MKQILTDYLEICNKFRAEGLSKVERKRRHSMLQEWEKKEYGKEIMSIAEIQDFWHNHDKICWNQLFIQKVICPAVAADVVNNGREGLIFLFQCFRGHENSYIYSDSPLEIFCQYCDYKYEPIQLANLLLEYDSGNMDALQYKYHALKESLAFSIHEIPSGILNGMNGASVSDISAMLKNTEEFEMISKKLDRLDSNLIADCRIYYNAYKDYLQNLNEYKNFEDYLNSNCISYQPYTKRYDYDYQ